MKLLCLLLLIGSLPSWGQANSIFDVPGVVELVDRPPDATPVEAVLFCVHQMDGVLEYCAQPNPNGQFILTKVQPGRYSLKFSMPGRITSFTDGAVQIDPQEFELGPGSEGPIRLVVSMRFGEVSVTVRGIPSGHTNVVALLVPADNYLTLRAGYVNSIRGPQIAFPFLPLGKYRIFIVDQEISGRVAGYAPHFPDFLKNEGTPVEVATASPAQATATYLEVEKVEQAIRKFCPDILRLWRSSASEPLCRGEQARGN